MAFFVEDDTIIKVKNYSTYDKWPNNAKIIGYRSFDNIFTYEIVIPDTIEEIRHQAFFNTKVKNIVLPSSLKKMGEMVFYGNESIKNINIKGTLKEIPASSFSGCTSLQKIIMPSTIEKIEMSAFNDCSHLNQIKLPNNLKIIDTTAFQNCINLKIIEFPESIEKIGIGAFKNTGLTNIELPKKLETINDCLFSNCHNLESVKIPNSVIYIKAQSFDYCTKLSNIELSSNLEVIEDGAFSNCASLKSVSIPVSLQFLGAQAFEYCFNLKSIDLPNVSAIEKSTFCRCNSLEKVKLSNFLTYIGEDAFNECVKLKKINISQTQLKQIGSFAFNKCISLEKVELATIETIGPSAFNNCIGLKELKFPNTLKNIDEFAFYGCKNINKIEFLDCEAYIGYEAFCDCKDLKEISFSKDIDMDNDAFPSNVDYERIYCYNIDNLSNKLWIKSFINGDNSNIYINEETGQFLIQNNKIKHLPKGFREFNEINKYTNLLNCSKNIAINLYINNIEIEELEKKNLLKKDAYIKIIGNDLTHKIKDMYNAKEFFNIINIDSLIFKDKTIANDYIKFAFSIGAFEKDDKVRQRACNFITSLFDKQIINAYRIHEMFDSMIFNGYNEEWQEFIMDKENLKKILTKEREQSGFTSRIYNDFHHIKEFNRSNRGEQHYRKVTYEACISYLSSVAFSGINDTTEDIASTISAYTRNQASFDDAKSIREEYIKLREEGKIIDHILNEELKEIEAIREDTINDISETLTNLNEISNKKFTYEFLSKYDPRNFVLGKYCSCCAHLEGAGYGIMKASILHPSCQNLVIKDGDNIIAKSTLYINEEQGYGVFNNVEVSSNVDKKDKQAIYDKYKQAINDFVKKYNELPNRKPLTQINVGMNLNDLDIYISENHSRGNILKGINFSKYGKGNKIYDGDWQEEQYIMWKS